jgi:hypothetical protein
MHFCIKHEEKNKKINFFLGGTGVPARYAKIKNVLAGVLTSSW